MPHTDTLEEKKDTEAYQQWLDSAKELYEALDTELLKLLQSTNPEANHKDILNPERRIYSLTGVAKFAHTDKLEETSLLYQGLKNRSHDSCEHEYASLKYSLNLRRLLEIEVLFRKHGFGTNIRDPKDPQTAETPTGFMISANCLSLYPKSSGYLESKNLKIKPITAEKTNHFARLMLTAYAKEQKFENTLNTNPREYQTASSIYDLLSVLLPLKPKEPAEIFTAINMLIQEKGLDTTKALIQLLTEKLKALDLDYGLRELALQASLCALTQASNQQQTSLKECINLKFNAFYQKHLPTYDFHFISNKNKSTGDLERDKKAFDYAIQFRQKNKQFFTNFYQHHYPLLSVTQKQDVDTALTQAAKEDKISHTIANQCLATAYLANPHRSSWQRLKAGYASLPARYKALAGVSITLGLAAVGLGLFFPPLAFIGLYLIIAGGVLAPTTAAGHAYHAYTTDIDHVNHMPQSARSYEPAAPEEKQTTTPSQVAEQVATNLASLFEKRTTPNHPALQDVPRGTAGSTPTEKKEAPTTEPSQQHPKFLGCRSTLFTTPEKKPATAEKAHQQPSQSR